MNTTALMGQFSDTARVLKSDEETAIMDAAPPDSEAGITLYWVASPAWTATPGLMQMSRPLATPISFRRCRCSASPERPGSSTGQDRLTRGHG